MVDPVSACVKLSGATVIAVASAALLVSCGSGSGKTAAPPPPPTTTPKAAPSQQRHTPPSSTASHSKTSKIVGEHGPVLAWIRRLQRDLTRLHYYSAAITGRDSQTTRAAIIRFQRAAHLKPDGLWGPRSQAALDKTLHRTPSKPPRPLGWIRNLQHDLKTLHFYSGPVTGVETPATKNAIIHFQLAAHLKPDGLWGAKSQLALDKLLHRH